MGGEGAEAPRTDDEREWVDNWNRVEESLSDNVPNRGNVTILNVNGAKQEGDTKREGVEFDDGKWDQQPRKARSNTVDEGKNDNNAEVDGEVNESSRGGGDDHDVLREADFAQEIATIDNGLNTLTSALSKEIPKYRASQEINWVMRNIVTKTEEFGKDDV